jgi:hypothetical protein
MPASISRRHAEGIRSNEPVGDRIAEGDDRTRLRRRFDVEPVHVEPRLCVTREIGVS